MLHTGRDRQQCRRSLRFAFAILSVVLLCEGRGEESPSAAALLRGVELARTTHDSLRAELEIEYLSPGSPHSIQCVVEQDGDRRRFEVLAIGKQKGRILIKDGDVFTGYRRWGATEDVYITDTRRAGDRNFDPRVLGLTDIIFENTTVKDCMWYEESEHPEIVGQESINGVDVWRVRAVRERTDSAGSVSEYWIEEPTFRVYRRTDETEFMSLEVNSEFDPNDTSPFPIRVHAMRVTEPRTHEIVYSLKSLEPGAAVPPERFTLASMDLPVNTAVVDYRISRRIGFWDGDGLSELPVANAAPVGLAPPQPPAGHRSSQQIWLILINAVFLTGLIGVILLRRRRSAK